MTRTDVTTRVSPRSALVAGLLVVIGAAACQRRNPAFQPLDADGGAGSGGGGGQGGQGGRAGGGGEGGGGDSSGTDGPGDPIPEVPPADVGSDKVMVDAGVESVPPGTPPCPITLTAGDEDGDGVKDSLDTCPGLHNTDQKDGDGDKVGDVCDPQPGKPGNKLVLFDRFDDAKTMSSWRIEGPWKWYGTEAGVDDHSCELKTLTCAIGSTVDVLVMADFHMHADDADCMSRREGGLVARASKGPMGERRADLCVADEIPDPDRATFRSEPGGATAMGAPSGKDYAGESWLHARFTAIGSGFDCRILTEGDKSNVTVSTPGWPSGDIGLTSTGRATHFHWIAAYSIVP